MRNKLTAKEIAESHGVSERTAYRWLSDNDPRSLAPEITARREAEYQQQRAAERLKELIQSALRAHTALRIWQFQHEDHPINEKVDPHISTMLKAINGLTGKDVGLFPQDYDDDSEV